MGFWQPRCQEALITGFAAVCAAGCFSISGVCFPPCRRTCCFPSEWWWVVSVCQRELIQLCPNSDGHPPPPTPKQTTTPVPRMHCSEHFYWLSHVRENVSGLRWESKVETTEDSESLASVHVCVCLKKRLILHTCVQPSLEEILGQHWMMDLKEWCRKELELRCRDLSSIQAPSPRRKLLINDTYTAFINEIKQLVSFPSLEYIMTLRAMIQNHLQSSKYTSSFTPIWRGKIKISSYISGHTKMVRKRDGRASLISKSKSARKTWNTR